MAAEERERIRGIFNRIAARYDVMNRIMTFGIDRGWRRSLVRAVPRTAARVLDIATGTADVACALSAAATGAPAIVGIDNAEIMLAEARRKIKAKHVRNITLVRAAAEKMPFAAGSFDAAVVAFGIRNCTDNGVVLAEAARVLRKGGVLAVLEFFRPDNIFTRIVQGTYVRLVIPLVARLLVRAAVDAYRYLGDSIAAYLSVKEFRVLAERSGFLHIRTKRFLFGVADLTVFSRTASKIKKGRGTT
ncbi:MAG: ubiquinone/menaquinone biosynthesis methyltransferase [Spirochaetota bacterium]